ncbi:MAG: arylsulfatase [Bacteroidota bacterium]
MRYLTTSLFYLLIAFSLKAQAPNILLIIVDDQGYGDLSCHGNPDLPTPYLDELHRISTRLTDFHVSPTCSPTRAALMTGHVSNRTGVWHTIAGRSLLYEDETTLGDVFLENGYATGMFGKWHLGDNHPFRPMDNGFEHAVYHGGGGIFQGPDIWGNDYFDDKYFVNGKEKAFAGYCTDVWFNEAMDFMEEKRREEKPFFTYLATNSPHGPFWVEHRYSAPFANNPRIPNANFHGMIANLDENMGKMMAYLDRSGLRENTIVIFMTDNGTARGAELNKVSGLAKKGFNAGMRGLKNSRYEGGHRVPFFISWPKGGIEEGRNIDELTAHVDVLPTLIDLLDLKGMEELKFDGTSLKEILLNKESSLAKRTLITDTQRQENLEKWRMSAVMQDKWRLINGEELYDLNTDPGQQKDIAKKHPEMVEELRGEYEKWWRSLEKSANKMATISLCYEDEPTLIYVHDMHMDEGYNSVAWNQRMIREGFKSEGWFAVEALESGRYKFSLYRWVPELEVPIQAGIPAQPGVKGTSVITLTAGKALPIQKAGISIADKEMESEVKVNDVNKSFEVDLQKGKHQLRTWFQEAEGNSYGAFYVLVEKV